MDVFTTVPAHSVHRMLGDRMIRNHTNTRGGLNSLRKRVSPKRLEYLMDKREYRRTVSQEHAKTRGMAVMAFQNTIKLRSYLHRTWIGLGIGAAAALAALLWR